MKWLDGGRPDPIPGREKDLGRFEITVRDGQARLGRLHTSHGVLQTPCLLPVVNPNIRTIEPREMYDKYGIEALITNSYVIWKHDHLKEVALEKGVHELIDFPGVIMTDSGTFQSYVYGDVEVGVDEIVNFQREIGVDIATMLDVFSRPDMTFTQVEAAVDETINRAEISLAAAGNVMLNGPIQGGIFPELRTKSARTMSEFGFAIHPIGGIVPVMEQQRYKELAKIILASKSNLNPSRPVHIFGCGHPMLFPMLVALGADLFDSAAYALFARDGRLLTPWGTERIDELTEWPILVPSVVNHTPAEVRAMSKEERTTLLAHFNLEVTLQELSRCRQAVRDGNIWRLAERRSHEHPRLREAFLWLVTNPSLSDIEPLILDDISSSKETGKHKGRWEENWNWLVQSQTTPRSGSESWGGQDTHERPHVEMARRRIFARWNSSKSGDVLVLHGASPPWRERVGELVDRIVNTELEIMVLTPLGLIPWSLEDLNPWAHIDGPDWLWKRKPDHAWITRELERFGIEHRRLITLDISETEGLHARAFAMLELEPSDRDQDAVKTKQAIDKLCVLSNISSEQADKIMEDASFAMSRTGRIRNVITSDGRHIFSPRLGEGGISYTIEGAKWAHSIRKLPLPKGFETSAIDENVGEGLAFVVIDEDAVPFVGQGRNVMHGFILACDPWTRPDETVLIVNSSGKLVAVGRATSMPAEMATFSKGIAVRVREGIGCP